MALHEEIVKSFPQIEKLFSEEAMIKFINIADEDICLYHYGLGTWIRNHLLDEHSKLYKAFLKSGVTHKDDMSGLMIQEYKRYIGNRKG